MTDEVYKQQKKKPINPLEGFDMADAEATMAKIQEIGKNLPDVDPMTKSLGKDMPFAIQGNMPQEVASLFQKGGRAQAQKEVQNQMNAPIVAPAVPTNPKLAELLKGIRETYEEVKLPSLSKFYTNGEAPEGGVIHVRPMTGKEEEIFGTTRFLKKGQAINMIFTNCVKETINPEKWLTIDRTHLLIYLRGISHGPLYHVDIKCPLCGNRFESQIDLDALFVNYCPKDYDLSNLKGVLPETKYKFSFRLPTVNDETLISNYREKKGKETNEGIDDTFTWRTALLLEEIEGLNDHASLMVLLRELPITDIAHLRSVMNDIPFGVETKIGQWCSACNEDFEIELPIEANFFFPQVKKASRNQASK